VWLAFAGQALVDDRLRGLREEVDGLLHRFYAQLIDALADAGALLPGATAPWRRSGWVPSSTASSSTP